MILINIEKNQLTSHKESDEFIMRPLNIKKDYDELIPFYDKIFKKELSAKGISVKAFLDEFKSLLPFLKIIGLFSKNYRHVFDGFVYENNQGKIVSTVNIGYSGNFWEIAMVATHHEYRRKGLAKKLVLKSIEHAKNNNAKLCVLEVLEENEPAYNLYKNLGFQHFDTRYKLRLDKGNISSITQKELPDDYQIQKRKQDKQTGKEMIALEERTTPKEVLEFFPVNKIKYQKSLIIRLIRPIMKLFIRKRSNRWNIYHHTSLVGILYADVGRSENDCNSIDIIIDQEHQEKLTNPVINFALEYIKQSTSLDLVTITDVRKNDNHLKQALENFGFNIYETDHILGLKIKNKI